MLQYIISATIGYLSGSILFAWVVVKLVTGRDIRSMGDGNPGVNNVIRNIGPKYGAVAALLDLLKIIAPLLFIIFILKYDDLSLVLASIGAVLGHLYPIYFKFKGGRGATCIFGSYMVLFPLEVLISVITIIILLKTVKKLRSKALNLVIPLVIITAYSLSFLFNHSIIIRIGALIIPLTSLVNKTNVYKIEEYFKDFINIK